MFSKRAIIRTVYITAYYIGLVNLLLYIRKRPLVVTYHNIIDDDLYDRHHHLTLTVKASVFDQQLAILKEKFGVDDDLSPGKVTITFDDGNRNNLSVALPLLKKHGMTATFFIPADCFDGADLLWVERLLMWVAHVPPGEYDILGEKFSTQSPQERQATFSTLWGRVFADYSGVDALLANLEEVFSFSQLNVEEAFFQQRYARLTREEIAEMHKAGCRTACHSYRHDVLALLSDTDLQADFSKCSKHLGEYNSDWYAYPFGRKQEVDSRVVDACREAEYSRAFINQNEQNNDDFRIPRINMPETADRYLIYAKVSGLETLLKSLLK